MVRTLIQVDADLSNELTGAFPQLVARHHRASTTLIGRLADQQELQGVLNLLSSLGIDIVVMLSIPDE